jgi:hypothetical protein
MRHASIRDDIGRMVKIVLFHLGTQYVVQVKGLSTLEPFGIVGIDRKAWWRMHLLMNPLRTGTNVRERATLVKGPAIDMISVMQLIEDSEPVVQVRVSPVRLGNCVHQLAGVRFKERFVRGHSLGSQCI